MANDADNRSELLGHGQVHVAVIRLDVKVDTLVREHERTRDELRSSLSDHEHRIRRLENDHVSVERFTLLEIRPYISPSSARWLVGTIIAIAGLVIAGINIMK